MVGRISAENGSFLSKEEKFAPCRSSGTDELIRSDRIIRAYESEALCVTSPLCVLSLSVVSELHPFNVAIEQTRSLTILEAKHGTSSVPGPAQKGSYYSSSSIPSFLE